MVPASATIRSSHHVTLFSPVRIQIPGIVKAKPPATMEPADITVCVTFASFSVVLPSAFRKKSEMIAANTMGQGRAPILSAV